MGVIIKMSENIKPKATLESIVLGDVVIDKDRGVHEITQKKFDSLHNYKKRTGKSPIRAGKITGMYLDKNRIFEAKEKAKEYDANLILVLRTLDAKLNFKLTGRGWEYYLEGERIINKSQFGITKDKINKFRKDGRLPIDFTAEDKTRQFYNVEDLDMKCQNSKEFIFDQIKDVENLFNNKMDTSFWKFQKFYIQMLVEKMDLIKLFGSICEYYHIPIAPAKGRSDINQRNLMALRYKEAEEIGLIPVLLYYADHDPAGLQIVNDMKNNFKQIEKATGWSPENLDVNRFGLDEEFIGDKGLIWINNLITGSGKNLADPNHPDHNKPYVQDYIKKYGVRKCEANAILKVIPEAKRHCIKTIQEYLEEDGKDPFKEYKEELENNRNKVKSIMDAVNFEDRILKLREDINKL